MSTATTNFRVTFNRVRRELSKSSDFGFAFTTTQRQMKVAFRKAMIEAEVSCTEARLYLVYSWIERSSRLGGAA